MKQNRNEQITFGEITYGRTFFRRLVVHYAPFQVFHLTSDSTFYVLFDTNLFDGLRQTSATLRLPPPVFTCSCQKEHIECCRKSSQTLQNEQVHAPHDQKDTPKVTHQSYWLVTVCSPNYSSYWLWSTKLLTRRSLLTELFEVIDSGPCVTRRVFLQNFSLFLYRFFDFELSLHFL